MLKRKILEKSVKWDIQNRMDLPPGREISGKKTFSRIIATFRLHDNYLRESKIPRMRIETTAMHNIDYTIKICRLGTHYQSVSFVSIMLGELIGISVLTIFWTTCRPFTRKFLCRWIWDNGHRSYQFHWTHMSSRVGYCNTEGVCTKNSAPTNTLFFGQHTGHTEDYGGNSFIAKYGIRATGATINRDWASHTKQIERGLEKFLSVEINQELEGSDNNLV